jgi:hypothetical protein
LLRAAGRIRQALQRTAVSIGIVAAAYGGGVFIGTVLATSGSNLALDQRDAIVKAARDTDAMVAYGQDDRLKAAILDFGGNVGAAALTSATGLAVVGPLPIAAYRGWVGGIVSVDAQHRSRLSRSDTALYYLVTVTLQSIPYILTAGAGMYLGLVAWRRRNDVSVRAVFTLRIPGEALRDTGWIWGLSLPFFLAGSLFEFLA